MIKFVIIAIINYSKNFKFIVIKIIIITTIINYFNNFNINY